MTSQQSDNGNDKEKVSQQEENSELNTIGSMQLDYHNGDLKALANLLSCIKPKLLRKLAPLCDSLASYSPEDFFQEAYLKLCQPRVYAKYDPGRPFLPWVTRIIERDICNRKRRAALIRWILTKPGLTTLREKYGVPPATCAKLDSLLGKACYNEEAFKGTLAIWLNDNELTQYGDVIVAVACNRKRLFAVLKRACDAERAARFTPAQEAELREDLQRLAEAQARLDPFDQTVYTYRYRYGLKGSEIAAKMGTSEATISRTLHQLVPKLQRLLRQLSEFPFREGHPNDES